MGQTIRGHGSLEILKQRYADFQFPNDLSGRHALDVSAWDGWFSFELGKYGLKLWPSMSRI